MLLPAVPISNYCDAQAVRAYKQLYYFRYSKVFTDVNKLSYIRPLTSQQH